MSQRGAATKLEVVHPDVEAPEAIVIDENVLRDRLSTANTVPVEDVPMPKFVVQKGTGRVNLSEGLKRHLRQHPEKLDRFYESIVDRAIAGDHNATKLVFDRVEGAVPQRIGVGQLTTEQIAEMLQLDAENETSQ